MCDKCCKNSIICKLYNPEKSLTLEEFIDKYTKALENCDAFECDKLAEEYPEYVEPYLKAVGEWDEPLENGEQQTKTDEGDG